MPVTEAPFSGNGSERSTETARQRRLRALLLVSWCASAAVAPRSTARGHLSIKCRARVRPGCVRRMRIESLTPIAKAVASYLCARVFSVAVPFSVVRSFSVSSGSARLGHPCTAVSAAFLACPVSRNSLKSQKVRDRACSIARFHIYSKSTSHQESHRMTASHLSTSMLRFEPKAYVCQGAARRWDAVAGVTTPRGRAP